MKALLLSATLALAMVAAPAALATSPTPATCEAGYSLELTHTASVQPGDAVYFRGPFTNNTGSDQVFYVFFRVLDSGDNELDKKNLGGATIADGQTINLRNMKHRSNRNKYDVPDDAAPGTYTLHVVIAEDRFGNGEKCSADLEFTVEAP